MSELVLLLPAATTVLAFGFSAVVGRRWRDRRPAPHLLWWAGGLAAFGVGTLMEAAVAIAGWHPGLFRAWYVAGALLGGAPLAQGTVYLLLPRRTADRFATILVAYLAVAIAAVAAAPVDPTRAAADRLGGAVLVWQWVRALTPPVNLYAFVFLVGGAALSAWRFRRHRDTWHRVVGNVLIAVGALLPGIGGAATRFGHVEVLYVTEFVGLLLIWFGYRWNVRRPESAAR